MLIPSGPILGLKFGQDFIMSRTPVNYCSIDQIKGYLRYVDLDLHGSEDDPDDEFHEARNQMKSQVNGHTKSEFDYVRRLEWVDGKSQDKIYMRYYPIVDLEYIRVYNIDYQAFFQYGGDEMIVSNRIGAIGFPPLYIISQPYKALGATLSGFTFFPGKKNVQILYTTGFMNEEVPADFSDACARWAAGLMLRTAELRTSEGLKQRVISGVQETSGRWLEIGQMYIDEAREELSRYRRVEIW